MDEQVRSALISSLQAWHEVVQLRAMLAAVFTHLGLEPFAEPIVLDLPRASHRVEQTYSQPYGRWAGRDVGVGESSGFSAMGSTGTPFQVRKKPRTEE